MTPTPFLIVSDGPQEATGLGRIARDLGGLIVASNLDVDLVSVGGAVPPAWTAWPHVPMGEAERGDDWGARFVTAVWRDRWGRQPGVLWVIWDPGRLAAYTGIDLPVQLWSYPAIDAPGLAGGLGGPAGAALQRAHRVIAYGRWASEVIQQSGRPLVPYLPHGLGTAVYAAPPTDDEAAWADQQLGPHLRRGDRLIGCVATNQPRKDLALYFRTLGELKARGHAVYGWLHTDVLTKAWSIVQLVEDCGLAHRVTVTTRDYSDRQLALLYQRSAVTLAPGLGEGFGYPIVESLAAGTPVVHGDFGGGRELVPRREWRVPVRETRIESIYNLQRPVFRPEDAANAIERIWRWEDAIGRETAQAYCRGSVAHLDWASLWPRWRRWIRRGL
jgi:glycosyltransferase involved in cell wall biosynthesis